MQSGRLKDLISKPELNNQLAAIERYDDKKQRYQIKIEDSDEAITALKPQNLKQITDAFRAGCNGHSTSRLPRLKKGKGGRRPPFCSLQRVGFRKGDLLAIAGGGRRWWFAPEQALAASSA